MKNQLNREIDEYCCESSALSEACWEVEQILEQLRWWVEDNDYAGYEPYDLLNSPWFAPVWNRSIVASSVLIQLGRRFVGARTREWLRVPKSKNPKAIGLFLSGYCDLVRCGTNQQGTIAYLKSELKRLCSPGEAESCWGYDWNFNSLRGSVMRAFAPNAIATVFCANALFDAREVLGDTDSERMALSACRFFVTRLNRSCWDVPEEICFSYTPENHSLIFNNSLLVAAVLARASVATGNADYAVLASRAVKFACRAQQANGAWSYGLGRMQDWVDGFHSGYNLCAISAYRRHTGDETVNDSLEKGYEFYKRQCFTEEGVPKYFADNLYPIDIHACSQAIITFCEFADSDPEALDRAMRVFRWTIYNMRSPEGHFYYQKHRFRRNSTPYMRWGQAWMFRALARLLLKLKEHGSEAVD